MRMRPEDDPAIVNGAVFRMADVEVFYTQLSNGGPRAGGAFRVFGLEFRFWEWAVPENEWRVQASYSTVRGDKVQYHQPAQTRTEVSFSLPVELQSGAIHLVQLHAPLDQASQPDGAGPFQHNPTIFEWRVKLPEPPVMLKKDSADLQCDWDGQVRRD